LIKRTYDVIRKPFDASARRFVPCRSYGMAETKVSLPVSMDLRPVCPPVYDQGSLGSCTGNGWAFLVEWCQVVAKWRKLWTPSRMFIYYDERVLDHDVNQDAGASVADGGRVVTRWGTCKETTWPYIVQKYKVKPSAAAYNEAAKYKIQSVATLDNTNVAEVKAAIAAYHPVVMGFDVYKSFESDQVAANGLVPLPGPGEKLLDGHCTVIVGYNDAFEFPSVFSVPPGCYIVRNSWGPHWGLQGYFLVPYSYFDNPNLASDYWTASGITGTG
jgi:C1A family cysteine protease